MADKSPEPQVVRSDAEWRDMLTADQYQVCRRAATEAPHTGRYWNHFEPGVYRCVCCDAPLFDGAAKFASHCGWPSYTHAVSEESVIERADYSHGMIRSEVLCATCHAHLGHVFDDGPPPRGTRYCINSVCLTFTPSE